jgi:DNA primase
MDMIMPFIHGVDNIAACLGTALTSDQVSLIGRYAQNVVMLFDTDAAGQSAIVRSLDLLLEAELNVRVATLEQGEDPDSFIRKRGLEDFNARIDNAQPFLDFKFNWLSAQYDPRTVEGKDKISQELLSTIDRCKSEVVKYELTKQLAQKLNIPEGVLLKQAGREGPRPPEAPEVPLIAPVLASSGQELLLALFLKDAAWARAALEKIGPEDFTQGPLRNTAEAVLKLAREKGEWSTADLLACLDDMEAQSVVARLIHIEAMRLGDETRVFEDCIEKIRKEKQKMARGRLMEAIRRAEASHDTEKLDQLREQFNQLLRT